MTNLPYLVEMPGHLIRRLHQHSTAVFQRRLSGAGFDITSVQFSALETLSRNAGLDQATLAKLIAYDPATIGSVVKNLERKGLVQREANARDRRAYALLLTPKGAALLEAVRPIVRDLQSDILDRLPEGEARAMIAMMQKALDLAPEEAPVER